MITLPRQARDKYSKNSKKYRVCRSYGADDVANHEGFAGQRFEIGDMNSEDGWFPMQATQQGGDSKEFIEQARPFSPSERAIKFINKVSVLMEALPGKVASASAFASERNRGAAANAAANTHSVTEPNTYGAPFNISAK